MLYPTELRADAAVKQVVGVKRFELPTSCSQSRRATGLRYTPRESRIIRKLSTLANFFVKKIGFQSESFSDNVCQRLKRAKTLVKVRTEYVFPIQFSRSEERSLLRVQC